MSRAVTFNTLSRLSRPCALRAPLRPSRPVAAAAAPLLPAIHARHSSHSPLGATPANARKKVTLNTLQALYRRNEPITMITAYDFPSAHVADHAGVDMVLVGDSLAMVTLGMEDTSEITLEEMIVHCRSVARATKSAFTIGDLPMGSYEIAPSQALETAIRMVKEGRVQGIKLEGGIEMAPTVEKISRAGIPVIAHIGLTPQRQNSLGGFRVQGKTTAGALKVLKDALAVQEAGAFAILLEAVPAEIAALITKKLQIPTIGIGAGNGCSGQVLVQVDMLGNFPPGRFLPKFVKQYGNVWAESMRAISEYRDEVKSRAYPAPEHTYPIPKEELAEFERQKTLALSCTPSRRRRKRTTVSNRDDADTLATGCRSCGAEPTGRKRTVTVVAVMLVAISVDWFAGQTEGNR
ncbi:3-methyl-2-oxobutanoate hydroxymethyltransferase [Phyllosticta citrichinensis]|uniref:3-methyl-2-oxobutanoate hydroxymethyltransferase n=1 Tax=Phyllosticta citrichinensis TaxID=1130410 RepID=A0ABR1XFR2_9PEZI